MRKIIVAIDGYSACGKSTTAKEAAKILGFRYIDSGAMYRAVTLSFLDKHVALTNPKEVERALGQIKISFQVTAKGKTETFLNGLNVEKEIRDMRVSEMVSQVSTLVPVRVEAAGTLVLVAAGADKAGALQQVLEGPEDPLTFPAQILRHAEGEVAWFLDSAAAGQLSSAAG